MQCLIPINLLFGRKLIYFSNTISTVVKKLTVHSSTTNKVSRISNHFWDRRRYEYVINLRETQPTSKLNINSLEINANDIVLIYVEKVPRHFWRIAIVTRVLPSRHSEFKKSNSKNRKDQYNHKIFRK